MCALQNWNLWPLVKMLLWVLIFVINCRRVSPLSRDAQQPLRKQGAQKCERKRRERSHRHGEMGKKGTWEIKRWLKRRENCERTRVFDSLSLWAFKYVKYKMTLSWICRRHGCWARRLLWCVCGREGCLQGISIVPYARLKLLSGLLIVPIACATVCRHSKRIILVCM